MKDYKIDYTTNTITLTKKFATEAGILGTDAFKTMAALRGLGMTFVVKESKPRKSSNITFKQMKRYIQLVENSSHYMEQFEMIRIEAVCQKNPYQRVLTWFKETFPNFRDLPEFNGENKIIVTPHDYNENEAA